MKNKVTIQSILADFKERIEKNMLVSPASWVESAIRLNVLLEDIDNQIDTMEAKMAEAEMELIEKGEPASKAKALKISAVDSYENYLKLKSLKARIEEHIRLAKKRSTIQDI